MSNRASYVGDATIKYETPDKPSHKLSESTWNPEETNNLGLPQEVEASIGAPQTTNAPVRILIVGPSGSGKTIWAIKDTYCGSKEPMIGGSYEATKHVLITGLRYNGQALQLIDTPGFDNIGMSDLEAFTKIAEYLLDPKNVEAGISGIIYSPCGN
ncbi:unnamed protein product [Rhizoctonia solani]|uniref:G domain-containing protein n=1 Tax=Rhizoctonia solani TaxID=456999 RepID=A0A8H3HNR3_9AGAM|nr:unnamed protein product [Rhizoctonia solani]